MLLIAYSVLVTISTVCFGSEHMKLEDVAVLCVLVLLLRVRPFPEPGFAELGPLLRVNICTLDACISGFVC